MNSSRSAGVLVGNRPPSTGSTGSVRLPKAPGSIKRTLVVEEVESVSLAQSDSDPRALLGGKIVQLGGGRDGVPSTVARLPTPAQNMRADKLAMAQAEVRESWVAQSRGAASSRLPSRPRTPATLVTSRPMTPCGNFSLDSYPGACTASAPGHEMGGAGAIKDTRATSLPTVAGAAVSPYDENQR